MSSAENSTPAAAKIIPMEDLPTEPYTVIRVVWQDPSEHAATMFTLSGGGSWASADGVAFEQLSIVDFEVLSKPLPTALASSSLRKPSLSPAKALEEINELVGRAWQGGAVSTSKVIEILNCVPGHWEERKANDASERYNIWVFDSEEN